MGNWTFGTVIYTCVIFVVTIRLAMTLNYHTWVHHLCLWGSILIWFAFLFIYSALDADFHASLSQGPPLD